MKKILSCDMDEVLANFSKAAPGTDPSEMYKPGFFLNLEPMPGSQEALRKLWNSGLYDIHILSQPVAESPISYTEKAAWIAMHFPYLLKKITLTQNKELFRADYLIDDASHKWQEKFEANGGKFIKFDYTNPEQEWKRITEELLQTPIFLNPSGLPLHIDLSMLEFNFEEHTTKPIVLFDTK